MGNEGGERTQSYLLELGEWPHLQPQQCGMLRQEDPLIVRVHSKDALISKMSSFGESVGVDTN